MIHLKLLIKDATNTAIANKKSNTQKIKQRKNNPHQKTKKILKNKNKKQKQLQIWHMERSRIGQKIWSKFFPFFFLCLIDLP